MTDKVVFSAVMQAVSSAPRSGWLKFPFGIRETFGKGRVKVHVVFDGKTEYRGSLVKMSGEEMILVRADVRAAIGKKPGDLVHVELWEDKEERKLDLPRELSQIFIEQPGIKSVFERLSYTTRREAIIHINEGKMESTRWRRAKSFIEKIKNK